MSLRIISPTNSFVQFGVNETVEDCNYPSQDFCLPVFEDDDVNFQFVIQTDTTEEADALCTLDNSGFEIGLVKSCSDPILLVLSGNAERFRISDLQVLYNWSNGFTNFKSVINVGQCFFVKVIISETEFCSNCFQRILNDCHTSVIEYSNDENAFGFNYCNSGSVSSTDVDCDPTFITFTNQLTLAIPYTAAMIAKYGNVPTIKCWIYDTDGTLTNMVVRQSFDNYPPTQILVDLGGSASGVLKIS